MNFVAIENSFWNCMFVPKRGWYSGYHCDIHVYWMSIHVLWVTSGRHLCVTSCFNGILGTQKL